MTKALFLAAAVSALLLTADTTPALAHAHHYPHYRPPQAASYPEADTSDAEKDKGSGQKEEHKTMRLPV